MKTRQKDRRPLARIRFKQMSGSLPALLWTFAFAVFVTYGARAPLLLAGGFALRVTIAHVRRLCCNVFGLDTGFHVLCLGGFCGLTTEKKQRQGKKHQPRQDSFHRSNLLELEITVSRDACGIPIIQYGDVRALCGEFLLLARGPRRIQPCPGGRGFRSGSPGISGLGTADGVPAQPVEGDHDFNATLLRLVRVAESALKVALSLMRDLDRKIQPFIGKHADFIMHSCFKPCIRFHGGPPYPEVPFPGNQQ